jgi:hypothetical protein
MNSSSESMLPVVLAGVAISDTLFRREMGHPALASDTVSCVIPCLLRGALSSSSEEEDGFRALVAALLALSSPSSIAASTALLFLVWGGVVKAGTNPWQAAIICVDDEEKKKVPWAETVSFPAGSTHTPTAYQMDFWEIRSMNRQPAE